MFRRFLPAIAASLVFGFAACSSCTPPPPEENPEFSVGGTVTGLQGQGLILQLNGGSDLAVTADGPFTFATKVAKNASIAVTVKEQPTSPAQTCVVTQPTTVVSADVTDISVACTTDALHVGGTVMGLEGSGLVLQLNGANDLEVTQNGPFEFPVEVKPGDAFTVTVLEQPTSPSQTCEVIGGSGTVVAGEVNTVSVNCSTLSFVVGGTVSGLAGTGLVLENNHADAIAINANGAFAFPTPVRSGDAFSVTVKSQPVGPAQTCTVSNGEGTVANGNVTSVVVTCETNGLPVGGTVTGLLGSGLVLQNNLGDNLPITADGPFTFSKKVPSGQPYSVTVLTQPSAPSQTCTVTNGSGIMGSSGVTDVQVTCVTNTFRVGGTVSGLQGSGLVLQNNGGDDLTITGNGVFTFATPVPSGGTFAVTVSANPTNPSQTCTVTGGTGTVQGGDVTSVAVNCSTNSYTIGGTVTGLQGSGLMLALNGGAPLPINANGSFAFPTPLLSGTPYEVVVAVQPTSPAQICAVASGTGVVGGADVTNVTVSCTAPTYTVGGTVTGLVGSGMVLRNNGGDDLPISANGGFTFPTPIISGQPYSVTVATQPFAPSQTCVVTNGAGTVGSGNVTSVLVSCTTNKYSVGGTISGLAGTVVLQNNGGNNLTLNANGSFSFSAQVDSGSNYWVTVLTQPISPSQTCTVTNGFGTVTNANVTDVQVTCVTNTYTVGGMVVGLAGSGLVLQNNLGDDVTVVGTGSQPFTFPTRLASGQTYSVTVKTQPTNPWQQCTVSGGTGTVGATNVKSITVNCTINQYTVGGTVVGLSGSGLVLQNNGGDDLPISGNGTFAFPQPVPSGSPYLVTVKTHPTSPTQFCGITNGSGTMAGANVTSVEVNCTAQPFNLKVSVSGLTGTGLVLQNNGGDNLAIPADGIYTFPTMVPSGSTYNVTVLTQPTSPDQVCTVSSPTGIMGLGDQTIPVFCVNTPYPIGGTVTGLTGPGLVLQNNNGETLPISSNGAFTFPTPVPNGSTYQVTVQTQPSGLVCYVTNGSGTVNNGPVTNIQVTCNTNTGFVFDVAGNQLPVMFVPCGNGTSGNCTQAVAESSCAAIGRKLVSHASNGTSTIASLGATNSCNFSISYFINFSPAFAGQCLVGVSNAAWSSCCGTNSWHGNTVTIPTTLGQQFGFVNSSNSGYDPTKSNVSGTTWGCYSSSTAAGSRTGCTVYNVACL
ncbi:MAG: hypothetical protein IRZ16_10145 [Myxococcaceae bacterium]|nr:hypothetical protein [Myxococcaceae bacterium]